MAVRSVSIELNSFQVSLKKSLGNLAGIEKAFKEGAALATVQFAEHILGEAGAKAPLGEGPLRASATVEGPVIELDVIVVYAAFNIVYARMRDLGGEILPVRAEALFIPLRKGVRPGEPGLVRGVDFVFAKRVVQKGNRYWSSTLDENVPNAAVEIGQRAVIIAQQRLQK